MFWFNHHHQGAYYSSLLKLLLLKSNKIHRCVVNLVVWLHILHWTTNFKKNFVSVMNSYIINLFVCIYEVRKGT
jgi:hypothetical protein